MKNVWLFSCLMTSFVMGFAQTRVCNNSDFPFSIPEREKNCMRAFNKTAAGVNDVNGYLLAKMTELMYPERMDYQLRFLRNNRQVVSSLPNTDALKTNPLVTDANFECAFATRFSHYFYDEAQRPRRNSQGQQVCNNQKCLI